MTPFWHFWNPKSGAPGGIIAAIVMWTPVLVWWFLWP